MNQPDDSLLKCADVPRKRRLSYPNEPAFATRRNLCCLAMTSITSTFGGSPGRIYSQLVPSLEPVQSKYPGIYTGMQSTDFL